MSPAPPDTLPRSPAADDALPGPNRTMRRWLIGLIRALQPAMAANAERCGADRYRKHFDHFAHLVFLLYHGVSGHPSLRTSYATLPTAPGLMELAGLATADPERLGISFSQLAASQHSRPAAVLSGLLPELIARVRAAGVPPGVDLPVGLYLLDSTFVHLALGHAPWLPAKGGTDPAGVRVQTLYVPAFDLVEQVVVTDTRTNDCQGFDQLLLDDPEQLRRLAGATLVVDLGYYSHARFAQLRGAGVHVVSRLHPQAVFHCEAEQPVQAPIPTLPADRIVIQRDCRITLGSAKNQRGAVLPGMRLVTATVQPTPRAQRNGQQPVVYRLVTDRWDLSSREVVQTYLWRWQIELFFRWLKQRVRLPNWLGYSRNAVELTIALAIVVHLLLVLLARTMGLRRRSPALLARLRANLSHVSEFPTDRNTTYCQLSLPWAQAPP